MRGDMPWEEDAQVDENVVVCSFLPRTGSALAGYRPCAVGYRLHLSDVNFQLYDRNIGNTFIFINRPPRGSDAEVQTSIALQKISATVQRVSLILAQQPKPHGYTHIEATWAHTHDSRDCHRAPCRVQS